jgi:hypothetical protein
LCCIVLVQSTILGSTGMVCSSPPVMVDVVLSLVCLRRQTLQFDDFLALLIQCCHNVVVGKVTLEACRGPVTSKSYAGRLSVCQLSVPSSSFCICFSNPCALYCTLSSIQTFSHTNGFGC